MRGLVRIWVERMSERLGEGLHEKLGQLNACEFPRLLPEPCLHNLQGEEEKITILNIQTARLAFVRVT